MLNCEACVADPLETDLNDIGIDSFFHYIAENVDHSSDTIDGLNAFHSIGMHSLCNKRKKVSVTPTIKRETKESSKIVET